MTPTANPRFLSSAENRAASSHLSAEIRSTRGRCGVVSDSGCSMFMPSHIDPPPRNPSPRKTTAGPRTVECPLPQQLTFSKKSYCILTTFLCYTSGISVIGPLGGAREVPGSSRQLPLATSELNDRHHHPILPT